MGWQDAPEVSQAAWAAAPVVEPPDRDDGQKKLAEGTGVGEAMMIGAGRMGDRLYEGLKQAGMGIGAIMSEALPDRLKRAAQEALAQRLMAQESRMKSDSEAYRPLEQARPVATALGESAPLVAMPMLRLAQGAGAGAAAINAAASSALPAGVEYGTAGERAARMAAGGVGGAVGSGLTTAAAKVYSGVANTLTPEARRLAALAEDKFNIPLDAAQKTGNKSLQTFNAALETMPVTSGAEAARIGAQRDAFTREVMKTTGEAVSEATPATFDAAKKRIGGDFERIFSKVHVNLDEPTLQSNLGKVIQEANDTLLPDQAKLVAKRVGEIIGKIDDNGAVAGKAYQAWRSQVQKQAENSSDQWLATHLRNVYRTVDEAAYKAAADVGEDAALRTARSQYKNLKTIEPLVAKSENGVISPALLRGEVMRKNPDFASGGGGDLAELAKIGRSFIADQVPNSGTAQRQLAQSLLTGGGVGGLAYMTSSDPTTALKWGVGSVMLPKVAQTALRSAPVQRYLSTGAQRQLSPIELALMDRAARLGTLSVAGGLVE